MTNFYVFDFDGVVCDSTNECLVCSSNAMQKLIGNSNYKYRISEFNEDLQERFTVLRPFVKGGSEYYTLYQILNSGISIKNMTQSLFDEMHKTFFAESEEYKPYFYQARKELQEYNFLNWLELHTVYEWVIDFLKIQLASNRLMVATLKDKDSVLRILEHYNLLMDPSLIIDQSEIKTKLEALNKILKLQDVTKEEIVFIDDNIAHLMAPKSDGFKSFMAAWSNVSESSKALAKANNIDILNNLKIFSGEL
jgi:phosphoglycolate phosphatase-like HAD superfamily hydrolase